MSEETNVVVEEATPAVERPQARIEVLDQETGLAVDEHSVTGAPEVTPEPLEALPLLPPGFTRKTIGQWYDASIALYQIVARPRTLPMLAQYKIARMRKAIEHITEHVDSVKIQLVQELGEPMPNVEPTKWQLKPENKEVFAQRITQVTQMWTDIKIRPLGLSELGTPADNNGIDAREFELLGDLVIDDVTERDDANI